MTLSAGDYFPGSKIEFMKQGSTVAIAKGTLLKWDTTGDGWLKVAGTTADLGPYAVCVEASSTGATQVLVCTRGFVAVNGDGTIEPNDLVMPSTSTAGKVMTYTARSASVAAAMSEGRRFVGRYIGHEDEGDGTIATDGADAEVIIIDLGGVT